MSESACDYSMCVQKRNGDRERDYNNKIYVLF